MKQEIEVKVIIEYTLPGGEFVSEIYDQRSAYLKTELLGLLYKGMKVRLIPLAN